LSLLRQKPGGVVEISGPEGVVEMAASTCAHCNRITPIPPGSRAEDVGIALCHGCMKLICRRCAGLGCRPIERWIEQQEAKGRMLRDILGPERSSGRADRRSSASPKGGLGA
jgi:hypothetical protein